MPPKTKEEDGQQEEAEEDLRDHPIRLRRGVRIAIDLNLPTCSGTRMLCSTFEGFMGETGPPTPRRRHLRITRSTELS